MSLFESIILGIIQGITEWLPISSEGIASMVMVSAFGKTLGEAVLYSIWLHTGTLLAALVYFWKDISALLKAFPNYVFEKGRKNKREQNMIISFLIITTLLSGSIGGLVMLYSFDNLSVSGAFAMAIIGVFLVITGVLQIIVRNKTRLKKIPDRSDSIILGLIQSFSVIPGLSRSGLTISVLLFRDFNARTALRLSFLMSIPLVLIAQIGLGLLGEINLTLDSLIAVIVAFGVGLFSLTTLMKIAEKMNFGWFCIILGLLAMLGLLI